MTIQTFDIGEVIDRLAAETASTFRLVAGVASLTALRGAPPPASPAAYVYPKEEASDENASINRTSQRTLADFGVLILTNDVSDAHGGAATDALRPLKDAVLEALLGFEPASAATPITHVGGNLVSYRDGYVGWDMTLSTDFYLRKD